MKKRLLLSDILLFTISGILDFFQEIKDPGGLISNYFRNFYGFVPLQWRKIYLKKIINNNLKTKKISFKKSFLVLTKKGKEYLKQKYPLFYLKSKNEKDFNCWWLIIFDITELNRYYRDRLRRLLKRLNIKMLQKSVWITPHKKVCFFVYDYIRKNKLEGAILILKGEFLSKKNHYFLVNKIWKLNLINQKYKQIFLTVKKDYQLYLKGKTTLFNLKEAYAKARYQTFSVLKEDPLFPPSLLPKPWYYQKILIILKKIWKVIKLKS